MQRPGKENYHNQQLNQSALVAKQHGAFQRQFGWCAFLFLDLVKYSVIPVKNVYHDYGDNMKQHAVNNVVSL